MADGPATCGRRLNDFDTAIKLPLSGVLHMSRSSTFETAARLQYITIPILSLNFCRYRAYQRRGLYRNGWDFVDKSLKSTAWFYSLFLIHATFIVSYIWLPCNLSLGQKNTLSYESSHSGQVTKKTFWSWTNAVNAWFIVVIIIIIKFWRKTIARTTVLFDSSTIGLYSCIRIRRRICRKPSI